MPAREILQLFWALWPPMMTALIVVVALLATAHVVLNKRDARAAVAWVGVIWLAPLLGTILYALFGINRIQRRAKELRPRSKLWLEATRDGCDEVDIEARVGASHLTPLAHLVDRMNQPSLVGGNRVDLLEDGDEAFPPMLEAIRAARRSIVLTTYIFDNDRSGREFLAALHDAQGRGVEIRVLIDDIGARYSFPPMHAKLARAGIEVARFLPTFVPWRLPYMNLRNHRKALIVDGRVAFTGGMNIREGNVLSLEPSHPIRDVHARVEGPVVGHLMQAFVEDWFFATRERLEGQLWFPHLEPVGPVVSRALIDGPDEDFEVLRVMLLGALSVARERVRILTPYFVPDDALITALGVAALRGVQVDIVLPLRSNLKLVEWASGAVLSLVLEKGCRVHLTPPPFDHGKLMVVDGAWTLLGSANWDARSLRLNFELNLECFDRDVAGRAERIIEARIDSGAQVTLADVKARSLPRRLRDGVAHLLAPYL